MVSGFRFPTDTSSDKSLTRIKVLNTLTSESCVIKNVTIHGEIILPSGIQLPPEVAERILAEWKILNPED